MHIKKLTSTAIIPTRATEFAAGFDLYADTIKPVVSYSASKGKDRDCYEITTNLIVHTGIAMEIPHGYVGLIFARSGLACKNGLRPANCVGVIDEDYRGEIIVNLACDKQPLTKQIDQGDRVAQIVFVKYEPFVMEVVDELTDTKRGSGGFGSTGNNSITW